MLRTVVIVFAAFYLTVWLPEETTAAGPQGNGVPSVAVIEHEAEHVEQQIQPASTKTTPLSVRPVAGVALLVALSTALFLLLRRVQRFSSSDKETADGEGEGAEGPTAGFKPAVGPGGKPIVEWLTGEENLETWGAAEVAAADPEFDSKAYPPAHPPVVLTKEEVETKIKEMKHVLKLIDEGEKSGSMADSTGESVGHRLREAFGLRQENKLAQFDKAVTQEMVATFNDLISAIEGVLFRVYGTRSEDMDESGRRRGDVSQ